MVLEPSDDHYYQPLFTLVGAGIERIEDTRRREKDVLPGNCTWIQDEAAEVDPKGVVRSAKGYKIKFDYLVVATGIVPRYEQVNEDIVHELGQWSSDLQIPGLVEALSQPDTGVCSIYAPNYAPGVYRAMQQLDSGNAVFTFPNSPVKCPGAPQKICYLTDDYLRKVHAHVIHWAHVAMVAF